MPLSVDELLKPRYKVIADFPYATIIWGQFKVGNVIALPKTPTYYDAWFLNSNIRVYFDKYPHLFKPLEWWEDRKISDMPGYLKRPYDQKPFNNEVNKVEKYQESGSGLIAYHNSGYQHVSWFIPATESEYLSYTNSLTTKTD